MSDMSDVLLCSGDTVFRILYTQLYYIIFSYYHIRTCNDAHMHLYTLLNSTCTPHHVFGSFPCQYGLASCPLTFLLIFFRSCAVYNCASSQDSPKLFTSSLYQPFCHQVFTGMSSLSSSIFLHHRPVSIISVYPS